MHFSTFVNAAARAKVASARAMKTSQKPDIQLCNALFALAEMKNGLAMVMYALCVVYNT